MFTIFNTDSLMFLFWFFHSYLSPECESRRKLLTFSFHNMIIANLMDIVSFISTVRVSQETKFINTDIVEKVRRIYEESRYNPSCWLSVFASLPKFQISCQSQYVVPVNRPKNGYDGCKYINYPLIEALTICSSTFHTGIIQSLLLLTALCIVERARRGEVIIFQHLPLIEEITIYPDFVFCSWSTNNL